MQRSKPFLFFISVLLLVVTAFSFAFATLPHAETCEHSMCDYCAELTTAETQLNNAVQTHQECQDSLCAFCAFIQAQQEVLQEKQAMEHTCHAGICNACMFQAFVKRIKALLCVVVALITIETALVVGRCIYAQKESFGRIVTLISLKVKLTD